ncbi:anti-anti-sigma factor [Brumimicrobium salinarum]|uniref:Anti-sigma factor antagonist n=1 Tax=Brumimicrobium salinarum TaxID=2058658 RepID=A0A2I0R5T5_9FLAO|nr:STAS domain-containing protein [Brumimicrobium salinarum]PKR81730.1 anti-anti-sigma factor [Brumimicrobium salinarum]
MNLKITHQSNYAIIATTDEKLNSLNAPALKEEVISLNKSNVSNLILDLSQTSYCDSSGLSAILVANRLCKNSNGKCVLFGLQPNVKKMIEIAQLHRVLAISKSLDEAVNMID